MTQLFLRGAAFGFLVGGLAACASNPNYPIAASPSSQPAAAPRAASPPPVSSPTPTPAPSTPAPAAPDTSSQSAPQPAPQAVESQPLAPLVTAPPPAATPQYAPASRPVPGPPVTMVPPPSTPAATSRPESVRYTAAGRVVDAHGMFRSYQVRKGDHLDAVARDLDTTRGVLMQANRIKNPDALTVGQRLKIPIDKAYVVQSGDTVTAVAKRFGVNAADLADLNAISEDHRLRAGDQLALPSAFHDGGPVPLPPTRMAGRFTPSSGYRANAWTPPPVYGGTGAAPPAYPSTVSPAAPALTDAEVMAAGRGRFITPVVGEVISTFGVKDVGRRNDGIDVKAPQGATVRAAAAGNVVYAGDQVPGFGNLVLVKHADGWVTAYAHLDRVSVKMRQSVAQGDEIGQVGQSGGVSEPQLHFEVRYAPTPADKARPVDPQLVLPKSGG